MPIAHALLLGAILASTDSAAVFALVRNSPLRRRDLPHPRGRERLQRPRRGAARARPHRLDRRARLGVWNLADLLVRQLLGGVLFCIGNGRLAIRALERLPLRAPACTP
jgi:hypothetical protein